MIRLLIGLLALHCASSLLGQDGVYPLYPSGEVPCTGENSLKTERKGDIGLIVTDVAEPELHHYAPVHRYTTGRAVMIVPGGGYWIEAWDLEGADIARRLAAAGNHAFVLRHRLPAKVKGACKASVALADAQRGMQYVKSLADSLRFDADRVGIMGFSAGGHLAGSASVHTVAGNFASRPDYSLLIYPVLIMDADRNGHGGSQQALLGEDPSPEQLDYFNLPEQVDSLTPPTLLVHASDDPGVPVANSLRYYEALVAHGVPADLRVYATGGHGFGTGLHLDGPVRGWLDEAIEWMRQF